MAGEIVYLTTGEDWLASYGEQLATLLPSLSVVETGSSATEAGAALGRAEALIVESELVNERLLERAPNLRLLQLTDTEYEHIDLAALEERGIAVASINEAVASPVASHVLDLAVSTARLVGHPGVSGVAKYPEIAGKTVGIVGMGYAGIEVARQVQRLRCEIKYHDVRTAPQGVADELGLRRLTMDRVLVESDYVMVLVTLTPQTGGLMDLRDFRIMKPEAILVNGSAPEVVNGADLVRALDDGLLAGAGITYRDADIAAHPKVVAMSYPAVIVGDAAERAVGVIVENVSAGVARRSPVESITFPVAGDPAFWSSRFAPRRVRR